VRSFPAGRPWLVLGARGQLGSALVEQLAARGVPCEARDSRGLDVADAGALRRVLGELRPAAVLNAAAYTDVDGCERDPARADAVNAQGPAALAALCAELGSRLLHVSTDYVFDGRASAPLRETDPVAPLSEYGRSKLSGERAVLAASPDFVAVRTSWVFGRGKNFIASVRARAETVLRDPAAGPLRVVDDQIGSPTYAEDLAPALLDLLDRGGRGLYHLANRGVASRLELARFALSVVGVSSLGAGLADLEIQPVKTVDFPLPAQRPLYTVLDCSRASALGVELRPWRDAVRSYLAAPPAPRLAANGG
jgi:dTDP-4-dehydrorhamnose reductase